AEALQHIAQLSHVSRPVVQGEQLDSVGCQRDGASLFLSLQEVLREPRDVVTSLPEGRNHQLYAGQYGAELSLKLAALALRSECSLADGDDADAANVRWRVALLRTQR